MPTLRPIFFDLETTGTRPDVDRIVEIAAYDPFLQKTFQMFVNPGIHIPHEASNIHGITDDTVKEAPTFAVAGASFIEFCSGRVLLVAHNGELFDVPFLKAECKRNRVQFPSGWSLVDSLKWARKYRRDLPRHSLQYLREMFKIPANRAHRALDDVMILHQVFSLMTDDLSPEEMLTCGHGILELADDAHSRSALDHQMELQLF